MKNSLLLLLLLLLIFILLGTEVVHNENNVSGAEGPGGRW